jgi:hypothetical protein
MAIGFSELSSAKIFAVDNILGVVGSHSMGFRLVSLGNHIVPWFSLLPHFQIKMGQLGCGWSVGRYVLSEQDGMEVECQHKCSSVTVDLPA